MKPATLLALPVLALAAATPAKVEERQLLPIPLPLDLPLDTACVLDVAGVLGCVPSLSNVNPTNLPVILLSQLIGLVTCAPAIILGVLACPA
ncbi:hypothetical protein CEP51_000088 [Fusarium floridanum]|uniref:Hydrophobin n=1 Tax=Fusarium floridanum TaxID=1325733 RepID=A0A428SPY3_9HYPO|nr:hypothetical protein CEP51_000088 [Fusarium floridanum]